MEGYGYCEGMRDKKERKVVTFLSFGI